MSHSRNLFRLLPRSLPASTIASRPFSTTAPAFVKAGDRIPDIDLVEASPGNKVNLAKELQGKGLVIGVPAAFSPACSASHIPGYLNSASLKEAGKVFVVSVNDAFVMKAWGATLDPQNKSGIRFLGDPDAKFTEALDLSFESASIFGNNRSKRYALKVEDGKVKEAYVEPDNTGVDVSSADKVLQ
ncbi:MAG: hypothetical protein L6R38_004140 [Xanthoria sp. 2 TBL-2021]|nr:MAG: hypothetical protein L6R38_004140 [Xanthoria sp. 2 TBL-2021]